MASLSVLFGISLLAHGAALYIQEGAFASGRLVVVLFSWLSLIAFGRCLPGWFTNHPRYFTAAAVGLYVTWFFGPLAVRLSPLPLATALSVIATALLVLQVQSDLGRRHRKLHEDCIAAVVAGFLFALAFAYERLFAAWILGSVAWSLRYGARKLPRSAAIAAGFLVAWLLSAEVTGRLAPLIGFMEANTALPWTDTGAAPQVDFTWRLLWQAGQPLGIFVILGPILSWWLKPRFSLTWVSVPYFLAFLFRGQGEVSLLFPLAPLVPIQIVMGARALGEKYPSFAKPLSPRTWKIIAALFVVIQIANFAYWALPRG